MGESSSIVGEFTDPQLEYRSLDPLAVGGLILGLLAPAALLARILWLLPVAGVVANVVALRRIGADSTRTGRAAALAGLALSVLFGVAPVVQLVTSRLLLVHQARPVADQWLEYLRERSPEKALMLEIAPDLRQPLNDELWVYYRNDAESKVRLEKFVELPVARALLELGDKAEIRFYKTVGGEFDGAAGGANLWYTVTYLDEQGKKKTFFVGVLLERQPAHDPDLSPWRVKSHLGGFDPKSAR